MQNLLIIEDNLAQSHFLANSICKEISNIRLYNIVSTGAEAINIIREEKVDIILLDLKFPDMTGIDIINFILKNNINKYDSSIIIVTGEMELLTEIVGNKCVFSYCSKTSGIDFIIKELNVLTNEKQREFYTDSLKNQIKIELELLNFDFSYIGTKYLCDCIYECYFKNNIYDINLKKDIYPIISKKYHKTINSIKTSIFQATTIMYYQIDEVYLSSYFGYRIINKPKTKDIIASVLKKIK